MYRSSRWLTTVVAFSLASVINPGYFAGCVSDGEKFEFGEAELLGLVDEANATGPFEFLSGSQRYRLEVSFDQKAGEDEGDLAALQQPFTARAFACGRRTFMQRAAACVSMSEMPLTATLDLYRLDSAGETLVLHDEAVDARLWVWGTKLGNGQIETDDYGIASSSVQLSLTSPDGKTFELAKFRVVTQELWVEAAR
jgi:hypothetical protein